MDLGTAIAKALVELGHESNKILWTVYIALGLNLLSLVASGTILLITSYLAWRYGKSD